MSLNKQVGSKIVNLEDGVAVEILKESRNPLINRIEITAYVHHEGKATPAIPQLRSKLSQKLNIDMKRLYIRTLRTEYGIGRSYTEIHIYDKEKDAKIFEPKYVIERNKTLQEEIEESEKKGNQ